MLTDFSNYDGHHLVLGLAIQLVCVHVHRHQRSRSENEKLVLQRSGEGRVGVQTRGEGWIIRELWWQNLRGCSCQSVEVQLVEVQ